MTTRRWISATAIITLVASAITACGGSDKKSSGGLEKANLTVATLPTPDAATLSGMAGSPPKQRRNVIHTFLQIWSTRRICEMSYM